MAVVLGKRSRSALEDDDTLKTSPLKRRHTRQSAPQIFEDTADVPRNDGRSRPSVRQRITVSKRITENESQNENAEDSSSVIIEEIKENVDPIFKTPSATRFKNVLPSSPLSTPRHRVRLAGSITTPRSNRSVDTPRSSSVYAAARQLFSQSAQSGQLVGRESERRRLTHFITKSIESGKGGCIYVSGPPGTGKSAFVQDVFASLQDTTSVRTCLMNCVTERGTEAVLEKLSEDLELPSLKAGKNGLEKLKKTLTSNTTKSLYLVLMDEIDGLLDGDCELLYTLFECAMHRSSSLILVGIANALDLTDRFLPRLQSRNLKPDLLPFVPYAAKDICNIMSTKLRTLLPADSDCDPNFVPFLHPAAIQLISKKIAAQTGDIRKAFTLGRRAIEQAEKEALRTIGIQTPATPTKQPLSELSNLTRNLPPSPPSSSPMKPDSSVKLGSTQPAWTAETAPRASVSHVARLAASVFNTGTTFRLGGLNLQQKAVLCSLVASERRRNQRDPFKTPSKSAAKIPTVKILFEKYSTLCQRDDGLLQPLKNTEFRDVVTSLETLGLVHEAMGRGSSVLTPSKTPSWSGRSLDDKHVISAVTENEIIESINAGAGADLLQRLLDDQ